MAPSVWETSKSCLTRLRAGFILLLLVAVLSVASTLEPTPTALVSTPPDKLPSDCDDYRLPTTVYPLHYDLEIQPYMHCDNPDLFKYRGSVKILVKCDIKTKRIVLHLNGPTVDPNSIAYYLAGSDIRRGHDHLKVDQKRQFFIITLDGYLQKYIKKYSYGIATHDDLFRELNEQAKSDGQIIDVKVVMEPWILQMNYPVVTVSRDFNNHGHLLATQSRFIADVTARDSGKHKSPFNYRWSIPLTFTSSKNPKFNQTHADIHWLYKEDPTKVFNLSVPLPDCASEDGWILANVEQQGYYRVNYKTGNWLALCRQLQKDHTVIATINRAQIIDDAWSLAKASYIPLDIALSTIEYLDKEHEYLPWHAALQHMRYMESALSYSSLYGTFEAFMRAKLQNPTHRFGLFNASTFRIETFTPPLLTEQACHYGIDLCTSTAGKQFHLWVKRLEVRRPLPNSVKVIACHAIASGGRDEWEFVLMEYMKSDSGAWKNVLLSSLACSKQPWILKRLLNMLLEMYMPLGDQMILGIITSVIQNKFGRYVAWDFYRSRYAELKMRYQVLSCTEALPAITEFFNTKLELTEVITFKRNNCSQYEENQFHNQIVAKIETNIRWLKVNTPIIRSWMADRGYLVD